VTVDALLLLVEDDLSVREVTQLGLQRAGFQVITARTAVKAWPCSAPAAPTRWCSTSCSRPRRPRGLQGHPGRVGGAGGDAHRSLGHNRRGGGPGGGADDYVTSPSRCRSWWPGCERRCGAPPDGALRGCEPGAPADRPPGAHGAQPAGEISLTPTEFRLLVELARRPGQVFTGRCCWSGSGDTGTWATPLVDVAVQRCGPRWSPTRPTPP